MQSRTGQGQGQKMKRSLALCIARYELAVCILLFPTGTTVLHGDTLKEQL